MFKEIMRLWGKYQAYGIVDIVMYATLVVFIALLFLFFG
jgi:hypothetical protein